MIKQNSYMEYFTITSTLAILKSTPLSEVLHKPIATELAENLFTPTFERDFCVNENSFL